MNKGRHRIFTVGFDLPGGDFEYVSFESDQTLLDADIVLFKPTLGDYHSSEAFQGKPLLSEHSSFSVGERLKHWRSEITAAVNAGKLVVVYLTKPVQCHRYTGITNFSGTGRNRLQTNIVEPVSSYQAVPNLKTVTPKTGKETRLEKDPGYFAEYWNQFSSYSAYEVEIEGEFSKVLLRARSGERIVGAAVHTKLGSLLFLPPLHFGEVNFVRHDAFKKERYWTEEAGQFGARLASSLSGLAEGIRRERSSTPPPAWTAESKYRLAAEADIEHRVTMLTDQITQLNKEKASLRDELSRAGSLRRLLYEQGKQLESAVLEALDLLGFKAGRFVEGESEFDAVFTSPEGRCLGEVEGKDNKAINVDKISQLERNLHEDFARDQVTEYAKGVLFGNAHRLLPPNERGDFFTDKYASAAARLKVALVRTPDLFPCAKYLKEHPDDKAYASECREAIFSAGGTVVFFPDPPVTVTSVLKGSSG
ncbi:MAG: hypothetical protein ABSD73_12475 [Candidatus Bathyarchaeia archaeon]